MWASLNFISCFLTNWGRAENFPESVSSIQLPSAQNSPYAKVAYLRVAHFTTLDTHQYSDLLEQAFLFTCNGDIYIASTQGTACLPNFAQEAVDHFLRERVEAVDDNKTESVLLWVEIIFLFT